MAGITVSRSFQPLVPQYVPWVTGRFYDGLVNVGTYTTTAISTLQLHMYPIFVPQSIIATSIGIETTGAGGAGSTARFALYENDARLTAPSTLILDAGAVAIDGATGYNAATISQLLHPGVMWVAVAVNNVTSNPTIRTFVNNALHSVYSMAYQSSQNQIGGRALAATIPGLALTGFPANMALTNVGDGLSWITSATMRILIGV